MLQICQTCGYKRRYKRVLVRCQKCGSWRTFKRQKEDEDVDIDPVFFAGNDVQFTPITEVSSLGFSRVQTQMQDLDIVLGGGFVRGSTSLLAGEPGSGKSTLSLQVAHSVASKGVRVGYISGEEKKEQARIRAGRIGALHENMMIFSNSDILQIIEALEANDFGFVVFDSIQSLHDPNLGKSLGSIAQIKSCCSHISRYSQASNACSLIVGHVTKENSIAGPRMLEHAVDAVFFLKNDREGAYRILRSHKNRYGDTSEAAVFRMTNQGLLAVKETENLFLPEGFPTPGSVLTIAMEGGKAIVIEIQVLLGKEKKSAGGRSSRGVDPARVKMIEAVLEREGIELSNRDLYVNVPGAVDITHPDADLAIAMGVLGSFYNKVVDKRTHPIAVGEVNLNGTIRKPRQKERKIETCEKLCLPYLFSSLHESGPYSVSNVSSLIRFYRNL